MSASDVGKIESGRLLPYEGQLAKLATALSIGHAEAKSLLDEHGHEDEGANDGTTNG